jgi:tRNA A-37 threonylcarbamoyl transferase component Bud32
MGLHVGEVLISAGTSKGVSKDLYGMQVDICSRVMALARGRQILMTRFAFDSARQVLQGADLEGLGPLVWMNHGRYRLKGVEEPLEVCAVGEQGSPATVRPTNTEKGRRVDTAADEQILGWRPAPRQVVPQTRWELERMLGEGGFGEVWLARHQALGHQCVFKFCFRADRARSLRREVTLFRVLRERLGAHPHIVTVRDVFLEEPPYYLAMDYSDSMDLRAWCESRGGVAQVALPVRLEIVAQVADALQAAHDAGVIHRDIKPSNILVGGEGTDPSRVQVKLTDFGIGQIVSEELLAAVAKEGFTQTGASPGHEGLTGTHLYMAPELVAGRPASAASDVYALGVVMYQLLRGDFTVPVTMDWTEDIKDPALRHDLVRCFAGDPQKRFQRVDELAHALRAPQPPPAPAQARADAPGPAPAGARIADFTPACIPLGQFYHAALTDEWCHCAGLNLANLPTELPIQARGGHFECRGIIQVGFFQDENLSAAYPESVADIPIGRKCRQLHFLHATLRRATEGAHVGSYVVQSAGGQREIPLIYGEDLRSWLSESDPSPELKRATTAWTGRTAGLFLRPVRLFKLTWRNPQPEDPIIGLSFRAAPGEAAPFLIALTAD